MNFIERHLAPDPKYIKKQNSIEYTINQRFMAAMVGYVAFSLPIVLIIASYFNIIRFRDTISHYYYSIFFGDIFIIMIAIIGTFLIAYIGESKNETRAATFAGLAAYLIALFPTSGTGIEKGSAQARVYSSISNLQNAPEETGDSKVSYENFLGDPIGTVTHSFELFSLSQALHGAATFVLFIFLAVFSYFVFTRTREDHFDPKKEGQLLNTKKRRNFVYRTTGRIIFLCIVLIAINGLFLDKEQGIGKIWSKCNATFWIEAVALWSFGFAWCVKSKFKGITWVQSYWQDEIND